MKEQIQSCVLPRLPIVGTLELESADGKSIRSIKPTSNQSSGNMTGVFKDCYEQLASYLNGSSKKINIEIDTSSLTEFEQKVLLQMKKVPFGQMITYKELAERLDSKGYQAVGSACGRNPLMLIYPCHRIIGSKDIGGFAHGTQMKKELLALEGAL